MTDRQSTHGHDCWGWGPKHYEGAVRQVERLAARLAAAQQPAESEEPLTDTYVQTVPDKCDRIVWRGSYYHLPLRAVAQEAVGDWVLVPRTPTDAMLRAAQSAWLNDPLRRTTTMWRAMLEAAPQQPAGVEEMQRRLDREESDHGRTIDQRDAAEDALGRMFQAVTGRPAEWSSAWGYVDAIEEVEEHVATLAAERDQLAAAVEALRAELDESCAVADNLARLLDETATVIKDHEPDMTKWSYHDIPDGVRAIQARAELLEDALRKIAEWPDGGNRYGQENIKRFAKTAIDEAMKKEVRND